LCLLFVVAVCGGALNAVGGGATFLVFPALVFAGVAPLVANVTATVALWPASIATAIVYRRNLSTPKGKVGVLAAASAAGAIGGAVLLLRTPPGAFTRLVPFLLLVATLVFTFGEPFAKRLALRSTSAAGAGRALALVVLGQVVIGVYGGYFGAGMGILMLAQLSLLKLGDMHAVNAVRSILTMVINAVCVAIFVSASAVAWREGAVMMLGAVTGGYVGAILIRRVKAHHVRALMISVAWTMTAYFFFGRGR
jgi:uncharacterized membrane protein YfcA